jgi:aminoglycoside phosphotransferase (APT) family kinase protein
LRDPLDDVAVRLGLGFRVAQLHHLRNGPISRVQLDIALSTLAQLIGPQDFWWPLVTGLSRIPQALVIEDTWGALARCLATRCDRVCAVFRRAEDATLLRSADDARNVDVVISPDPDNDRTIWLRQWPLIVLRRPAEALALERPVRVEALIARASKSLSPDGVIVVLDNISRGPWRLLAGRFMSSSPAVTGGLKLRRLVDMTRQGQLFVNSDPMDDGTLPEFVARRAVSPVMALREGVRVHEIRRRALVGYLAPRSVLAIGSAHPPLSLVQEVLQKHEVVSAAGSNQLSVKKLLVGTGDITVILAGPWRQKDPAIVLRAADRPIANARVGRNASALTALAGTELRRWVPRLLADERGAAEARITAETYLPSKPLMNVRPGPNRDRLMVEALQTLQRFRDRETHVRSLTAEEYDALVGSAFVTAAKRASEGDAIRLHALESYVRARLMDQRWALGPTHGDFKAGNIIVGRDGAFSGIIDWDLWSPVGLPMIDLMALCMYEDARDQDRHLGESYVEGLLGGGWRALFAQLINDGVARFHLDKDALDALKAAFFVINLRDRVHWLAQAHEDLALYLSRPLQKLCDYLGIE